MSNATGSGLTTISTNRKIGFSNAFFQEYIHASAEEREALLPAFVRVLFEHVNSIIHKILRRGDPHLAQEIAHDIILNLDTFNQRSLFSTWVYAFTRNRLALSYRKTGRFDQFLDADSVEGMVDNPEARELDRIDVAERLRNAPDEGVAVAEMVMDGRSARDIAKSLGISRHRVNARLKKLA